MSLIIALYLGEGIVMASDSRTTYNSTITNPDGSIICDHGVHFSDSTYKTFLTNKGVGISTCGQASITNKPIAGFIEDFINENQNDDIETIKDEIVPYFKHLDPNIDTHFIIGGYHLTDGGKYEQKLYRILTLTNEIIPLDTTIQGAIWDGEIDILSRILTPVHISSSSTYVPMAQFNVPFNHFTLQDAIDFAKYAIQATIDTMKFQERVKTVGGAVDILIIKPDNAFWITRKELHK